MLPFPINTTQGLFDFVDRCNVSLFKINATFYDTL